MEVYRGYFSIWYPFVDGVEVHVGFLGARGFCFRGTIAPLLNLNTKPIIYKSDPVREHVAPDS